MIFLMSYLLFMLWQLASLPPSLAARSTEYWAGHHPGRLWHPREACLTLRRSWWPTEDVSGWFWSSCCPWQRFRPTPESQRSSTPKRLLGKLALRLQLASRSALSSTNGAYGRLGTVVRLWMIVSSPLCALCLLFHVLTFSAVWMIVYSKENSKLNKNEAILAIINSLQ